jgi:hypothetical protein
MAVQDDHVLAFSPPVKIENLWDVLLIEAMLPSNLNLKPI